jgi:hypothetical protein
MAFYYVDGTISSASGTGSGTEVDPWGKDDDLLAYALDQILAGPGASADGDVVTILAGNVNSTTTPMLNYTSADFSGYGVTFVGQGRDRTVWDTGTQNYMQPYTSSTPAGGAGNGFQITCINMTIDATAQTLDTSSGNSLTGRATNFHNCDLLMLNPSNTSSHGRLNAHNQQVNIFGCRWEKGYNVLDSRSGSLCFNSVIRAAPAPSFERNSYQGTWINCLFDWTLSADTSGRGVCDYAPVLMNCTFLIPSGHNRPAVSANFDGTTAINCYQEGGNCFIEQPYSSDWGFRQLSNIYLYDVTEGLIGANGTRVGGYVENAVVLSESGLRDAANQDYRPADSLKLQSTFQIPAWVDMNGSTANQKTQRESIGCYTAQDLVGKPYYPRLRG